MIDKARSLELVGSEMARAMLELMRLDPKHRDFVFYFVGPHAPVWHIHAASSNSVEAAGRSFEEALLNTLRVVTAKGQP